MRFEENTFLVATKTEQDAALNAVQKTVEVYIGKCCIVTNKNSSSVVTQDGKAYAWTLQATLYRPLIELHVGDTVRIVKRDGSLDCTLPIAALNRVKRYLQIWL